MRKLFCLVLVLLLTPGLFGGALAEQALEIMDERLILCDDGSGYFFAVLRNQGDAAAYAGSGVLTLYDAEGKLVCTEENIATLPFRQYVLPGGVALVSEMLWDDALNAVARYDFHMDTSADDRGDAYLPLESTAELAEGGAVVTFTNTADEPVSGFYVIVAVRDGEERLIWVDGASFRELTVHPGSTISLKMTYDYPMAVYYERQGIVPVSIQSFILLGKD